MANMPTATRYRRTIGRSISSRFRAAEVSNRDLPHYRPATWLSPMTERATGKKESAGMSPNVAFR